MRLVLALLVAVGVAHAEPARVTLTNDSLWPSHDKPVSIRIGGAWTRVASGKTVGPIALAVPKTGKVMPIDVQAPSGKKAHRRWAVIMPDINYKLVGNPCAFWGLEIDDEVERPGTMRVEIDASALPAKSFPLIVSTSSTEDNEELSAEATLDKPGTSSAVELWVSAMCSRSGTPLVVYSQGSKKRLLDITLIAHPGAMHTLKLQRAGAFTVTVDPDR